MKDVRGQFKISFQKERMMLLGTFQQSISFKGALVYCSLSGFVRTILLYENRVESCDVRNVHSKCLYWSHLAGGIHLLAKQE